MSASPTASATASTVAGSSRSRVVAVCASSRWQRTSRRDRGGVRVVEAPSGAATSAAIGSPAHAVVDRPPLPMSCRRRRRASRSGRSTPLRISRLASQAGLDDVPVDGEAVHRRWRAAAAGSAPTPGAAASSAPVWSSVSQTAEQTGPACEQPDEQVPGLGRPRLGQQAPTRRAGAAASAGASIIPRSAAAPRPGAPAAGRSPGSRPVEHDLAGGDRHPAGDRLEPRARAGRRTAARREQPVDAAPGQPREVRGAAADLAQAAAGGVPWRAASESGPRRSDRPTLRGHPVARAAGGVPGARRGCRAAAARHRSRSACGTSTSQDGHQRLEHGGVPEPARRLLEVGTAACASSPTRFAALTHQLAQPREVRRGRRDAIGSARRCAVAGSIGGVPATWRASSRPSATRTSAGRRLGHLVERRAPSGRA